MAKHIKAILLYWAATTGITYMSVSGGYYVGPDSHDRHMQLEILRDR